MNQTGQRQGRERETVTTVSELTGQLAARARYRATTAWQPGYLEKLALAYDQHVAWVANTERPRSCGHADTVPYIIVVGAEDRSWCIECVKDILRNDSPPCGNCTSRTEVIMFPFGDIVAAGNICPDCGGLALTTGMT
jgi:hypothetical protein